MNAIMHLQAENMPGAGVATLENWPPLREAIVAEMLSVADPSEHAVIAEWAATLEATRIERVGTLHLAWTLSGIIMWHPRHTPWTAAEDLAFSKAVESNLAAARREASETPS